VNASNFSFAGLTLANSGSQFQPSRVLVAQELTWMLLLAYSQRVGVPELFALDLLDPGDRLVDRLLNRFFPGRSWVRYCCYLRRIHLAGRQML
jgi:hypothetical protein